MTNRQLVALMLQDPDLSYGRYHESSQRLVSTRICMLQWAGTDCIQHCSRLVHYRSEQSTTAAVLTNHIFCVTNVVGHGTACDRMLVYFKSANQVKRQWDNHD